MDARQRRIRLCTTAFVVLSLLLIVFTVSMLVIFKRYIDKDIRVYCRSPRCIQLKDDMESMLSKTIHPCDDFYSFVCGSWTRKTNFTGFLEDTVNAFYKRIYANFYSPVLNHPDRYGMHVLAKLYTACEQFLSSRAPTLKTTIEYTSKFINLTGVLQSRSLPELFYHLIRLSLTMEIHTTFSLQFRKTGEKPYLYLSVETNIQGKLHEVATEVFGKDRVASLSVNDMQTYIASVLTNIYEGKDVKEKAETLAQVDGNWDKEFGQHPTDNYRVFSELTALVGTFPLEKLLAMVNSVVPASLHLKMESTIRVRGYDIIRRIRESMAQSDLTITKLYYSVHLLSDVLQYTRIQADVAVPGAISAVCTKVSQLSLTHTWPYLVSRLAGYTGSPGQVFDMVQGMRDLAKSGVLLEWIESYTRREIVTSLSKLEFRVYDESELEQLGPDVNYTLLEVEKMTFVPAYLSAKAFEVGVLQRKLPTRETFVLAEHQLTSNLSVAKPLPLLLIPTVFQGPPIFYFNKSDDIPFYFNFATLGTLAAKEMVRYLKPASSWDGKSKQRHDAYIACLKTLRQMIGVGPVKDSEAGVWSDSIMNWVFGARYAYEATRDLLKKDGERSFSINWPAAQRVFFVRSCLPSCTSALESPVLPKETCLLPALSNEGFSDHFNCAKRPGFKLDSCVSSMFKAVN